MREKKIMRAGGLVLREGIERMEVMLGLCVGMKMVW
jgi:hypothetical protein